MPIVFIVDPFRARQIFRGRVWLKYKADEARSPSGESAKLAGLGRGGKIGGMHNQNRISTIAAALLALAMSAALALYITGYLATGYVGTFGRFRTRYYRVGWVAKAYWPMARVEELVTGLRVTTVQDVCSAGYVAQTLSKMQASSP
jgi:hypothetical protein